MYTSQRVSSLSSLGSTTWPDTAQNNVDITAGSGWQNDSNILVIDRDDVPDSRLEKTQGQNQEFIARHGTAVLKTTSSLTRSLMHSRIQRFPISTLIDYLKEDESSAGSNLFFDPRPIREPVRTANGRHIEAPLSVVDVFLIFADDDPMANWGHPCRYIFLSEDGFLAIAESEYPPLDGLERLLAL